MIYHRRDRITAANFLPAAANAQNDLCIIGGGATGAGCALDAQLRGLRTVLLEGSDFGSGASSASTKMAHGGVRYLQQAVASFDAKQFRLVDHSLHERAALLRNAPHLARPLTFVIPCLNRAQQIYYGIGVKLYDWIAGSERLTPSKFLSRQEALDAVPALDPQRVAAAVSYSDGQFDDARYNLALIDSFIEARGAALNYARVNGFDRDVNGKLKAAIVEDRISGENFRIEARAFVNATGPYSDKVRQLASSTLRARMRPSKGVHLLFPWDGFRHCTALLVPKTEDGRVIFAIPWQARLLVGTTDDPIPDDTPRDAKLSVTRQEAEYLLRQLNPYLAKPLQVENIVSTFAGIRPLVSAPNVENTKSLIRDDEVEVDQTSGLISILGGKWTTYRLMAERTIDRVEQALERPHSPCLTRNHLLAGARGFDSRYWETLRKRVPDVTARHLACRYGDRAEEVVELASESPDLAKPLVDGQPQIRAQVVYAALYEMATSVEDVLARRMGLQLYDWRKAQAAARPTAELLGREFGWSADQVKQAVQQYTGTMLK